MLSPRPSPGDPPKRRVMRLPFSPRIFRRVLFPVERRDFIKALASALVAVAVPAAVKSSTTLTLKKATAVAPEALRAAPIAGFNPLLQYGSAVHLSERTEKTVALGRELLMNDARRVLPSGTKFYVLDGGTARVHAANDETQEIDMLAWYYSPAQLTGPRLAQVIAEVIA